jgi:hypothetical protein
MSTLKEMKAHFKVRFTEWAVAVSLFVWGLILYTDGGDAFAQNPLFNGMASIAPHTTWGVFAMCIGALRLLFLTINGTMRRSAHIRAIGSGLSAMMWGTILGSYFRQVLETQIFVPNLATVGALLVLDIYSLWFAAEDAKLADLRKRDDISKD